MSREADAFCIRAALVATSVAKLTLGPAALALPVAGEAGATAGSASAAVVATSEVAAAARSPAAMLGLDARPGAGAMLGALAMLVVGVIMCGGATLWFRVMVRAGRRSRVSRRCVRARSFCVFLPSSALSSSVVTLTSEMLPSSAVLSNCTHAHITEQIQQVCPHTA